MANGIIFLTSKDGEEFDTILKKAEILADSGEHVRVLSFGDSVLSLVRDSNRSNRVRSLIGKLEFYACKEDIESRGLTSKLEQSARALNYDEIVDLIIASDDKVASYV